MMLSAKGGMDIEQVAKDNPKDLVKLHISPSEGLDKKDLDKFKNYLSEYKFFKIDNKKKYISKISTAAINFKFLKDFG